jgi:hypothetical protein
MLRMRSVCGKQGGLMRLGGLVELVQESFVPAFGLPLDPQKLRLVLIFGVLQREGLVGRVGSRVGRKLGGMLLA